MATSPEKLEAMLLDVARKLDRLLEIAGAEKPTMLSDADIARLKVLLPAVHTSIGPVVWTVSDLAKRQEPAIVSALAEIALNPKALGKLLARADSVVIGEYRIERAKVIREGALWCVESGGFERLSKPRKAAMHVE